MPTAREALLDAAFAALARRPWAGVRMVDVAASAGVSRQTLYNEFGSKDGLARALVRRETDGYLAGVERVLAGLGEGLPVHDQVGRLTAVAEWTVRAARANPLVRAVLTGCWGERLPSPARIGAARRTVSVPTQRRGDAPLLLPAELVGEIRDRAVAALERGRPQGDAEEVARACEVAVRLTLSCVAAPVRPEELARMIRGAVARPLARRPVSSRR